MRALIQRVWKASCHVDGVCTGKIENGLCVFVGFEPQDNEEILKKMARKICALRIFSDDLGKMNLSIQQVGGSILSISQFTLYAQCWKGNRPSFTQAAKPEQAQALYERFNEILMETVPVKTGIFQADMKIEIGNDGPVTIWLDSEDM